jgi:hypothetical protein
MAHHEAERPEYDGSDESFEAIKRWEDEPLSDENMQWAKELAERLAGELVQRQMSQALAELQALEPALLDAVRKAQAALAGVEVVAEMIDKAATDRAENSRDQVNLYRAAFEHYREVSGAATLFALLYELSEMLVDDEPWLQQSALKAIRP